MQTARGCVRLQERERFPSAVIFPAIFNTSDVEVHTSSTAFQQALWEFISSPQKTAFQFQTKIGLSTGWI